MLNARWGGGHDYLNGRAGQLAPRPALPQPQSALIATDEAIFDGVEFVDKAGRWGPGRAKVQEAWAMWNEPMPKWRTARKQYHCQGDGCAKVIAPGERYLDRAIRHPTSNHLRYCQECAEPAIARANGYHMFRGRNDFPDRCHQRVCSARWKILNAKSLSSVANGASVVGK